MADEPITTGSTYQFRETFTKDGAAWNLTAAVVTCYLHKPDGTILSRSATITDAVGGIAQYTTLTSDLDVPGLWFRAWKVVDGSVVMLSGPRPMTVVASP